MLKSNQQGRSRWFRFPRTPANQTASLWFRTAMEVSMALLAMRAKVVPMLCTSKQRSLKVSRNLDHRLKKLWSIETRRASSSPTIPMTWAWWRIRVVIQRRGIDPIKEIASNRKQWGSSLNRLCTRSGWSRSETSRRCRRKAICSIITWSRLTSSISSRLAAVTVSWTAVCKAWDQRLRMAPSIAS